MSAVFDAHVLGPVRLSVDGHEVALDTARMRTVLARLVLEPNTVVSAAALGAAIWPDDKPESWLVQLQAVVVRLRRAIAAAGCADPRALLDTRPPGYVLRLPAEATDLDRFRRLTDLAQREARQGRIAAALAAYRQAEAEWGGPALSDASPGLQGEADRLHERRVAVIEDRLALQLDQAGAASADDALLELRRLLAIHPWRERLHALLMTVLWQQGRAVDALDHYRGLRRRMIDELALEPGQELVALQQRILADDRKEPATPPALVPRQLPAGSLDLVGRDRLLAETAAVLSALGRPGGVPAVLCLHGPAGIGKTAAAVQLGHELAERYPDGQLFLRLRNGAGEALPPPTALARLLWAIGIQDGIPDDEEQRAAYWRTCTAGRRLLIVLDDANDPGQLRPLLPAETGCAVIATSRRPLIGLELAIHSEVPPLDLTATRELLDRLAGPGRLAADENAAQAVLRQCAGMPLAVQIVGARLAVAATEPLAETAAALADDARRLDWLVAGDLAVRTSLELAHRDLGPRARELFHRLAVVDADEFGLWVCAALADCDEQSAAELMTELVQLGLVQLRSERPRRFGLHDLTRSFAQERSAGETTAADLRLLQTAAHLAGIADVKAPYGSLAGDGLELPAVVHTPEAAAEAADTPVDWFERESELLISCVRRATDQRQPGLAVRLALRLAGYLSARDVRAERVAVLDNALASLAGTAEYDLEGRLRCARFAALAQNEAPADELANEAELVLLAARRADQQRPEGPRPAGIHRLLVAALSSAGFAARRAGHWQRARTIYEELLPLVRQVPDSPVLAPALDGYGRLLATLGELETAKAMLREAFQADGPEPTRRRAVILVGLAEIAALSGAVQEAAEALAEATEILRPMNDELGAANIACISADVAGLRGDWTAAEALLSKARAIFHERSDRQGLALALRTEGHVALLRGDLAQAERTLTTAAEAATTAGDAQIAAHANLLLRRLHPADHRRPR